MKALFMVSDDGFVAANPRRTSRTTRPTTTQTTLASYISATQWDVLRSKDAEGKEDVKGMEDAKGLDPGMPPLGKSAAQEMREDAAHLRGSLDIYIRRRR